MVHTSAASADGSFSVGGTSNGHMVKHVEFIGRAAHAGSLPHRGVNALQAAMVSGPVKRTSSTTPASDPAPSSGSRRQRLGGEERARRDGPAEDPVIGQPGGSRKGQRGLEHHLAAAEAVPGPEQRAPQPTRGRRCGHPVALPLEGVGGERHPPPPLAREETGKGHGKPRLVRAPHHPREPPVAVIRQARKHRRRSVPRLRPGERRQRAQHRTRPHLHQRADPEFRERPYRGAEPHRRPRLPNPVVPVQFLSRPHGASGHVAHQWHGEFRDPSRRRPPQLFPAPAPSARCERRGLSADAPSGPRVFPTAASATAQGATGRSPRSASRSPPRATTVLRGHGRSSSQAPPAPPPRARTPPPSPRPREASP